MALLIAAVCLLAGTTVQAVKEAAFAILLNSDSSKVFLVRAGAAKNNNQRWMFPGGERDPEDQNLNRCMGRKFLEELGVKTFPNVYDVRTFSLVLNRGAHIHTIFMMKTTDDIHALIKNGYGLQKSELIDFTWASVSDIRNKSIRGIYSDPSDVGRLMECKSSGSDSHNHLGWFNDTFDEYQKGGVKFDEKVARMSGESMRSFPGGKHPKSRHVKLYRPWGSQSVKANADITQEPAGKLSPSPIRRSQRIKPAGEVMPQEPSGITQEKAGMSSMTIVLIVVGCILVIIPISIYCRRLRTLS